MLRVRLFAALASLFLLPAAVPAPAREPAAPQTEIPRWEARGVGLPAWQGVACLDVNDGATRIAVGTIAPAGDPNVLLLDGDGKLLRQQRAGQRWINQVALGADDVLRALCTMPAGRAGDMPEVFRLLPRPLARGRVVEPWAGVRGVESLAVLLQEGQPLRHGRPPVVAAGGDAGEAVRVQVVRRFSFRAAASPQPPVYSVSGRDERRLSPCRHPAGSLAVSETRSG
jgi:hypothetical protein